ncbi:MAG: hypothetical protein JEY99_13665 [Spirochaetales bacterium]|nr:hypothetical protein [Spirochaetales bacterium]
MKQIYRHLYWVVKGVKVFALVGRSGTGKSFRAKLVAEKYGVDLIIDDGLLIQDQKIIAGRSAKKETAYLTAIKTALFDDPIHRREVRNTIRKTDFKRILIVGTSAKMTAKITQRLDLPEIATYINIEDIASREDIEIASHSRKEGKHVIPVPAVEVSRKHGSILYDTIKVFLKKGFSFKQTTEVFEKSVVRPEFGEKGKISISEVALTQMIIHCADEYDESLTINKVRVGETPKGYSIHIFLKIPFGVQLSGNMHDFQQYVIESLERYTGIMIEKVDVEIDNVSK